MAYKTSSFALYMQSEMASTQTSYTHENYFYLNHYISSISVTYPWNTSISSEVEESDIKYVTANIVLSNASRFLRMHGFNTGFVNAHFGRFVDFPTLICRYYILRLYLMMQGMESVSGHKLIIKSCTFDQEKDQITLDCEEDRYHVSPITGTYHILTNEINQQKSSVNIQHTYSPSPTPEDANVSYSSAHTITSLELDITPNFDVNWGEGTLLTTGTSYFNASSYTKKIEHWIESITINWNANVWGEITYNYYNHSTVVASS